MTVKQFLDNTSQEKSITVNGNYQAGIKLSVDDNNNVKGHIIADDVNTSGIEVELVYTDTTGSQETSHFFTDRNGRFTDEYDRLATGDMVIAKAQLQTSVDNRLDVISKLIPAETYSDDCIKTEDAFNYLLTEDDDFFIVEI